MNERIKLLAEQADEYTEQTVHYYQGQFDGLTWEGKIKQTRDTKFAELIVRECINQAHSVGDLRGANDDMIYGADTAAVKISKHFGVEE